ncbi:MAG: carboxypeptidase-like regulatory domain-containing protein [Bacteroidota bacterium]|nr:carboxypeptidase-like regulatory domain-containing protein [Bacteroidota bacterium]
MNYFLPVFLTFLLLTSLSLAQTNEVLLIGKVLDQKQSTLPGANIISVQSKRGTTTDKAGFFKIVVSCPDTLRISYIGFETQTIFIPYIKPSTAADTVISLSIVLKQSGYGLREAVIRAKKDPELVYGFDGKVRKWIYDYELQEDKIWILNSKGSKHYLTIVSTMGDTLLEKHLNFTPQSSFKDVYGTIFLLTEKSAKLVSYEKKVFKIYREITLLQFKQNVKPVVAGNNSHLFFRYDKPQEGIINFVQASFTDTAKTLFYSYSAEGQLDILTEETRKVRLNLQVASMDRQRMVSSNSNQFNQLNASFNTNSNMGRSNDAINDIDQQQMLSEMDFKAKREFRELNELYKDVVRPLYLPSSFNPEVNGWLTKLMMQPKFCPFILKNDTVFIFNHIIDSLHVFSINGQRLHSSYITYSVEKAKGESILLDDISGKFYYKYLNNGIVHLREIDVYTGSTVRNYSIEEMTFPEKVQVSNNKVYFLHKNKHEKGKRLYSLALD